MSSSVDVWLEAAYRLLLGGDRYSQAAAQMLMSYCRASGEWRAAERTLAKHLDFRRIITFDNPFYGSIAPYLKRILMSPTVLRNQPGTPSFARQVAILAHELWHTQQRRLDRYSVWGELEAHNFEMRVRAEIGAPALSKILETHQAAILEMGDPLGIPIPRDLDLMREGRRYLPDYWVYQKEPLYFWHGLVPIY